jgi:hypothetical protein
LWNGGCSLKPPVKSIVHKEKPMKRLTLFVILAAAACGGSSGKVSVMLTDAPGDFKAAVVTITQINLVGSGGVTTLSNTKVTRNLLTLSNDVASLVENATVQPGTYTELRFVISGGYVEVENAIGGGTTIYASSPDYEGLPLNASVGGTLKMPSFAQSGLKVSLPGGSVNVGTESTVLLVDFDVKQSFGHEAGASGSWVMHPVMTATDFGLSGTVNVTAKLAAGVTLPSLNTAQVTLGDFHAVLTNSAGSAKDFPLAANSSGSFGYSFKYLIPGSYTLSLTAPAGMSFTATPTIPSGGLPVTVSSGQAVQEDFTITAASTP